MRSIKRAVEWPGSRGMRITLPAADEDDSPSGRAFLSEAGLPPRTTTSGASRATKGGEEFGSNSTAKSTAASAAITSARSADGVIGRPDNPGFEPRRSRSSPRSRFLSQGHLRASEPVRSGERGRGATDRKRRSRTRGACRCVSTRRVGESIHLEKLRNPNLCSPRSLRRLVANVPF